MKTFKNVAKSLLADLKAGRDPAIAFNEALMKLSGHERDSLMLCRSEIDGTIQPRFIEMQVRERLEYVVTLKLDNGEETVTRFPYRLHSDALSLLENYCIAGKSATLTIE